MCTFWKNALDILIVWNILEEGDQKHEMEPLKICFCKDCKTLDYAGKKCLKCGSLRVVEAFLCQRYNKVFRKRWLLCKLDIKL